MACLIKSPDRASKGVVSFTTGERDDLILAFPDVQRAVQAMKSRYIVGLHHNWHDFNYRRDPLFDFNMAGEEDLIPLDGKPLPLIPLDACNFSPPVFKESAEKFWDVLFVARAVAFKCIPEFFHAIRTLYDAGHLVRVLFICPVPPAGVGAENGLRELYEKLFHGEERKLFTFLTMDFDYPFPFDMPSLAHFYGASRIFVHSAADERRCRVAAYAWASGMPVVGKACVGSLIPARLRTSPYYFEVDEGGNFVEPILRALEAERAKPDFQPVKEIVTTAEACKKLDESLASLGSHLGWSLSRQPIANAELDLRLGRHHGLSSGRNRVEQDIAAFIAALVTCDDATLARFAASPDPEMRIAEERPADPRALKKRKVSAKARLANVLRPIRQFFRPANGDRARA